VVAWIAAPDVEALIERSLYQDTTC